MKWLSADDHEDKIAREFTLLIFRGWNPEQENSAENREVRAASEHLTYLQWLRDVTRP